MQIMATVRLSVASTLHMCERNSVTDRCERVGGQSALGNSPRSATPVSVDRRSSVGMGGGLTRRVGTVAI